MIILKFFVCIFRIYCKNYILIKKRCIIDALVFIFVFVRIMNQIVKINAVLYLF